MIAAPKRKSSDIRIKAIDVSYEDFPYRNSLYVRRPPAATA